MKKLNDMFTYNLSVPGLGLYYISIFIALGILLLRNNAGLTDYSTLSADFAPHISNFSISYTLITVIGLTLIHRKNKAKLLLFALIALLILNVFAETVLTIGNTPDFIDAIFGVAGSLLGMATLLVIQRFFSKQK